MTDTAIRELDEHTYLTHPALSSSGARRLLPPSCPALFKHQQDNPPQSKPQFDFGHAAHMLVLGAGSEIISIDADDWRTSAAKAQRDAAYADGKTPLLRADVAVVEGMAQALRNHPIASAVFDPSSGKPEQSLFWTDKATGVECRARLDWLPYSHDGRMVLPDYKTTASAAPGAFAKSCANYGYHQQAAWYIDAVRACGLADDVAFVFVAQEKTAPYLITVADLDADDLRIGDALNHLALEVYAECHATNTWPTYSDDVVHIRLPAWATRQSEDLLGIA